MKLDDWKLIFKSCISTLISFQLLCSLCRRVNLEKRAFTTVNSYIIIFYSISATKPKKKAEVRWGNEPRPLKHGTYTLPFPYNSNQPLHEPVIYSLSTFNWQVCDFMYGAMVVTRFTTFSMWQRPAMCYTDHSITTEIQSTFKLSFKTYAQLLSAVLWVYEGKKCTNFPRLAW